ncbi:hypothetical protein RNJ44_04569 [Nakaseomyces bracarensis]|uniref:Uncharacterized protein n=1 Tax=Nakaseomyces bracarensis TaxID=273131 RepID=A0ABR4NVF0_9SACH
MYEKINLRKVIIPSPRALEWRVESVKKLNSDNTVVGLQKNKVSIIKRGNRALKTYFNKILSIVVSIKGENTAPPSEQDIEQAERVLLPLTGVVDSRFSLNLGPEFDLLIENLEGTEDNTTLSNDVPQIIDYYLRTDREEIQLLKQHKLKILLRKKLIEQQIADLNSILSRRMTKYQNTRYKVMQLVQHLQELENELENKTLKLNNLKQNMMCSTE